MDIVDLVLAIAHHLLVFSLAGILAIETFLVAGALAPAAIARLARIDRAYGLVAVLIIIVGVGRVFYSLKGSEFYIENWVFWAKMASFAAVGLLSIVPTIRFIAWNRQAVADPGFRVPDAELRSVRLCLRAQGLFFVLILVFAAAMARGFGY